MSQNRKQPRSGRFLSEDPIGLASGINPYVFAGDNPINGTDPLGLDHCKPPYVHARDTGQCELAVAVDPPWRRYSGGFGFRQACRPDYPAGISSGFGCFGGTIGTFGGIIGDGAALPGGATGVDTGPPSRLARCLQAGAGVAASFALDAAGVNLVNAFKSVRGAVAVRGFAHGMAERAGQLAGTRVGAGVAGYAYAAFGQSSAQLIEGTLQTVGRIPGAVLAPAPFDAPIAYVARNFPILGTGIRLGETAHVCLGNL